MLDISHSYLLPIVSDSVPIFDEICKRTARFITLCLSSPSRLVSSIAAYGVVYGRYSSILGSNALFCCEHVCMYNNYFKNWHKEKLSDSDKSNAEFLCAFLLL